MGEIFDPIRTESRFIALLARNIYSPDSVASSASSAALIADPTEAAPSA